jgi:hypothetical protein
LKDWQLMQIVIANDFTFVTHNAKDFRGIADAPGKGFHAREELHAGLVCLNSFEPLDLDRQTRLLRIAFEELSQMTDLVNQALEVSENEDGSIDVADIDPDSTTQIESLLAVCGGCLEK